MNTYIVGVIHYDGRRYKAYVQNVNQQRENFLREVAARTAPGQGPGC